SSNYQLPPKGRTTNIAFHTISHVGGSNNCVGGIFGRGGFVFRAGCKRRINTRRPSTSSRKKQGVVAKGKVRIGGEYRGLFSVACILPLLGESLGSRSNARYIRVFAFYSRW